MARRGELLAEQFLLGLKPDYVTEMPGSDLGFDYIAFFTKPDKAPVAVAVQVKTTERGINGRYAFPAAQLSRLFHANLPVLILVIDVKNNEIYFNWIKDAVSAEQASALDNRVSWNIALRLSTPEEQEKLRLEILM